VPEPVPEPAPEQVAQIEAPGTDAFDAKAVIETLKRDFGAEVVKQAFSKAEITTFSQLTPEKADEMRAQLQMEDAA